MMWFRPETIRIVEWGGNPHDKQPTLGPHGTRLTPRASFELFRESVRNQSRPAILRASDEGIGVAEKDRANVFDWYYRGRNARRAGIPGIGIGLAGVKDIVEQHGGTIDIESNVPRGSIFTVKIPLRPAPLDVAPESDRDGQRE